MVPKWYLSDFGYRCVRNTGTKETLGGAHQTLFGARISTPGLQRTTFFESMGTGYPLVNVYTTIERSTIFHGKTHYFDWAIFNSYVCLPEGR